MRITPAPDLSTTGSKGAELIRIFVHDKQTLSQIFIDTRTDFSVIPSNSKHKKTQTDWNYLLPIVTK